jgi:uncharacterized membrane protein YjfL (UPF0719 family)
MAGQVNSGAPVHYGAIMNSLVHGLLAAVLFTVLGLVLLLLGAILVDLLTPGRLRHQVWDERNRNAAIVLSSALLAIGAITFTAIMTSDQDLVRGLISTAIFGVLGLALMAGVFWLLDMLTPGKLGTIIVDPDPHPAVWVTACSNLAVAAIVCASIS